MLLSVSIVTRLCAFSTNASTKILWKFSDCPLFSFFEVVFSIAGSRSLVKPAIARLPGYLYNAHRWQTDCSSHPNSPDRDDVDFDLSPRYIS